MGPSGFSRSLGWLEPFQVPLAALEESLQYEPCLLRGSRGFWLPGRSASTEPFRQRDQAEENRLHTLKTARVMIDRLGFQAIPARGQHGFERQAKTPAGEQR